MNVCQTLICLFFLSLQDGHIALINAEDPIHTGSKGGNITVVCTFTLSGRRRLFCKEECEDGGILIDTEETTAQSGRYSVTYKEGFYPAFETLLYVSITKLTESDAGRYRCGLRRSVLLIPSYSEFEIGVEDVISAPPASTPMTTQSSPSSASPVTTDVVLYVRLTLVVMFIVLSAAVVMFYRKRARKLKEAPVEPEYDNVTETNRVYEEIREEDRQSRSPPVEMSQTVTEDDSSKLTYYDMNFSEGAAASLHSAPHDDADNAVYSVPRADVSSGGSNTEDAPPPLYSTVTKHQL